MGSPNLNRQATGELKEGEEKKNGRKNEKNFIKAKKKKRDSQV